MVIEDKANRGSIEIERCGSRFGNGLLFLSLNEHGNEVMSIFTNDQDEVIKLRDELTKIIDNPESFIDPFVANT